MNIKATFQKISANRKRQTKEKICIQEDKQKIVDTLSENYQETVLFLRTATMEEIAIAVEVLCPLVKRFPRQELVEIFKQKRIQYKKVDLICCVSYEGQIKEAERILLGMEAEKNFSLKESFREILEARERGKKQDLESYIISHGYDHETMRKLLCRDYQETIAFLQSANQEETATAIEILDDLVACFKSREFIEIFRKKAVEFSSIDDICEYDYFECIEEAESYLKEF